MEIFIGSIAHFIYWKKGWPWYQWKCHKVEPIVDILIKWCHWHPIDFASRFKWHLPMAPSNSTFQSFNNIHFRRLHPLNPLSKSIGSIPWHLMALMGLNGEVYHTLILLPNESQNCFSYHL